MPRPAPRSAVWLVPPLIAALASGDAAAQALANDRQPRESAAALGAHHLCSGMWVVGRDYARSAEQVLKEDIVRFTAFAWQEDFEYEVDAAARTVTVFGVDVPRRTARYTGDQGCTILPDGAATVYFEPVDVISALPDATSQRWPTGDMGATASVPEEVNRALLGAALDWAMAQEEQNTRALVIVYRGGIIGERYAPGWTKNTPQISWSQGKSITAALIGVLAQQGHLDLDDPAPVPEWQKPGDPRRVITIADLLRMSSGLDFTNNGLSGIESFDVSNEHMRIYFDALNVFEHAVDQPAEFPPNTVWRYRNSDPLTLGKIVKETVESGGGDYLTFPQHALFDRIGARNYVLETDAWGNFIMTGYDFGSAYDWVRFGLLHLWDGVWEGERILPEGWVEFISSPAPADENDGYGGLFWLNRGGRYDRVPEDAYWAAGFMGQTTMVIPSRDVVVVRLGPSPSGFGPYLNRLVGEILDAIGSTESSR